MNPFIQYISFISLTVFHDKHDKNRGFGYLVTLDIVFDLFLF